MFFSKNRITVILIGILVLATFLRLWNLGGPDVVTDEAINSFRAVGMVDFLSTEFQTTPLEWLKEPAWWLPLSFHDHPLLSFGVQHVFFRLFGQSVTVMRLPFALFGILSVWLVYLLVKEILRQAQNDKEGESNIEKVALACAAVMAVGGLSVWISRIALQEAMVIALGLLIILLGVKAMNENRSGGAERSPAVKRVSTTGWYWFGIALGVGMMTKYTVILYWFIVMVCIFVYSRNAFRKKEFWFAHLIALALFTPALLYNIGLYRQFGHFDLQFSYLLGQHVSAWTLLPGKPVGTVVTRFVDLMQELGRTLSPVMIGAWGAGLLWAFYRLLIIRKGTRSPVGRISVIGLMGLIATVVLISVMGPGIRFLPMLMPWAAIAIGALGIEVWERRGSMGRSVMMVIGIAALLYELGFSVNSNVVMNPIGPRSWAHSQALTQGQWWGYNTLEQYLHEKVDMRVTTLRLGSRSPLVGKVTERYHARRREEASLKPMATLFIVDINMNWFPRVWYINRRTLYEGLPVVTADDYLEVVRTQGGQYYREAGFEEFIFIKAENTFLSNTVSSDAGTLLADTLTAQGVMPQVIMRPDGVVSLNLYEFR